MHGARAILDRELAAYRQLLALEINKARWLEGGEIDRATAAQEECERLIAGLKALPDLFAELPDDRRPTPEAVRSDPATAALHADLARTIDRVIALSARNQERVRALMERVTESLRELDRGRRALRGYGSRDARGSQYLDGNL